MNGANKNPTNIALPHEGNQTTVSNTAEYKIGYKKPPKHTRFKKGQSGNKKGRPKGAKGRLSYALPKEHLKEIFMDEAYRMINIREDQKDVSMPMSKAIMRSIGVKAAKGNVHAQRLFTKLLLEIEAKNRTDAEDNMTFIIEYKKHWTEVLEYRKKHNIAEPDPVPHPDNIILDMNNGTVSVKGPLCEEDKAEQGFYRRMMQSWEVRQAQYEAELLADCDDDKRIELEKSIQECERLIPVLRRIVGDEVARSPYEIAKELGVVEF